MEERLLFTWYDKIVFDSICQLFFHWPLLPLLYSLIVGLLVVAIGMTPDRTANKNVIIKFILMILLPVIPLISQTGNYY